MSNVCGNDDVDEKVGAEEWMDDEEETVIDEDDREEAFEADLEDYADHLFGVGDRAYPYDGQTIVEPGPKKMRFGMQLAPGEGACRIDGRDWRPLRSWRKHLFKKRGNGLKCRRCGFDPDEIPF